jgi:hypothetical protein
LGLKKWEIWVAKYISSTWSKQQIKALEGLSPNAALQHCNIATLILCHWITIHELYVPGHNKMHASRCLRLISVFNKIVPKRAISLSGRWA